MKKKHLVNIKKTLLVFLIPVLSVPFALFASMLPVSATGGTYNSLSIQDQIKDYQYYAFFSSENGPQSNSNCVPVSAVQDSDIANLNVFHNGGGSTANLSNTGSSIPSFDCGSKSDVVSALKVIGLSATEPGEILCELGYTQTEAKGSTVSSCGKSAKTNSAHDTFVLKTQQSVNTTDNQNIVSVRNAILKNSTVFAGTAPTWTDAMEYYSTLADFTSKNGCSAQDMTGQTLYNVTDKDNIFIVDTDGSIVSHTFSYTNKGYDQNNLYYKNMGWTSDQSCAGVATNLAKSGNKYVTAYQAYLNGLQCNSTYSDSTQAGACAKGHSLSSSNISYCTTNYPDTTFVGSADHGNVSTIDNSAVREACYVGQGYPGGAKCYVAFQTVDTFTACVNGRANSTDPNYCTSVDGQGQPLYPTNGPTAAACIAGQKFGPASGLAATTVNCTLYPTSTGCGGSGGGSQSQTSCVLDGIGWLVCPLINAIGGLNDAMYGWVESVLVLNPLTQTDSSGNATPQYQNWAIIRNIANVLLVIGFLAIIFSQISSIGISNYGVKKMLPRIILVAIAINLSWTLMSLAVDVVNVVGVGIHTLLSSLAASDAISNAKVVEALVTGASSVAFGGAIGTIAIIASGSTAPVLVLLALPFLLGAALALIAAVATLFVRNALVIILVIIAPVAIAASILPNTEEYFKKWRKLLTSMLFLFPMAAVLFAGCKFAAFVILTSNTPFAVVAALFIMAAPLGMLPWLARSSGGIMATVGNRLGGMAKGLQGAAQKGLAPRVEALQSERKTNERSFLGRKRNGRVKGGHEVEHEEAVMEHEQYMGSDGKMHLKYDQNGNPVMRDTGQKRKVKTIEGGTPRRRNLSQMWAQSGERLKTRSETAKKNLASDSEELGLDRPGRPGKAKVAAIYDQSRQAGLRSESIGAEYKGRLEVSKLIDGDTRAIYDRLQDAGTTTKALEEEQALRQKTRIVQNAVNTSAQSIGLARLADISRTDGYVGTGSATRLEKLGNLSLEGGGGAGLHIIHENTEAAEQGVKTVDSQLEAELAERKKQGGDLFTSAASEAAFKAQATAAGKRFDSTIKEFAGDKTPQELRVIQLGEPPVVPDSSDKSRYAGGAKDPQYKADMEAWTNDSNLYETKKQQLADAESGGLRQQLQAAALEDYVAGSRIQQAEAAKTLGIDKQMTEDTPEAKRILADATGVGTQRRVQAGAGKRVKADIDSDTAAEGDLLELGLVDRDESLALTGKTINGEDLFDEKGVFKYKGADADQVWNTYVSARKKASDPVPDPTDRTAPQKRPDIVQQEALIRRLIREGDEDASRVLERELYEMGETAHDAEEAAKAAQADPNLTPDKKAEKVKEAEALTARARRLQNAALRQWTDNGKSRNPLNSSADWGAYASGTSRRSPEAKAINTLASGKMDSPEFAVGWNIKWWDEISKPLLEIKEIAESGRPTAQADAAAALKAYIEKNMELDGKVRGTPEWDKNYQERLQSFADAQKTLDEIQDNPAYEGRRDGRAKNNIAAMRKAYEVLSKIPDPDDPSTTIVRPVSGNTPYRRPKYTKEAGKVMTVIGTTLPVYADSDDKTYYIDQSGQPVYVTLDDNGNEI